MQQEIAGLRAGRRTAWRGESFEEKAAAPRFAARRASLGFGGRGPGKGPGRGPYHHWIFFFSRGLNSRVVESLVFSSTTSVILVGISWGVSRWEALFVVSQKWSFPTTLGA